MRRFLLLAASVAAVLVLGGAAGWAQLSTSHTVDRVQNADRVSQQSTLAGLTGQYLQFTFLATKTAADSSAWSLRPGDPGDHAGLGQMLAASPLTSYGATLTSLTGTPLTSYPSAAALPPPSDPGYDPLRSDLLAGKPGLSNVLHVRGVPVVAFAVPVERGGTPAGLLIVYADVRHWPLQGYTEKLALDDTAQAYVLDGAGVVAAGGDARKLGKPIAGLPTQARSGQTGLRAAGVDGRNAMVSYAPANGGWTGLIVQDTHAFSGAVHASGRRVQIALVVLLTLAVVLLVLFHYKRQQVLSRLADTRLYDPLTGLAQRSLFHLRVDAAFARHRRTRTPMGLLYCDVDKFKAVNDRYGHNVGDELLRALGARIRGSVGRTTWSHGWVATSSPSSPRGPTRRRSPRWPIGSAMPCRLR